ncbi:unnamed protein product, partial [Mesorhabditis belari]|uniref:Uncharacterized protein n=1 Tax=Mesorhabditis belari TaxID=2138241 RepID=A0AAF3F8I7_9BILA
MLQRTAAFLLLVVVVVEATTLPACITCPENGQWSPWSDVTTCSATCGLFGRKIQKRTCNSWIQGCQCKGVYSRAVPCAPALCPKAPFCAAGFTKLANSCQNVARANDYQADQCSINAKLNVCPCPSGGVWSAWANKGSCSATCGLCGTVNQTRTCRSAPYGCPCVGATTRALKCPAKPCGTGAACCNSLSVVKNLGTNATQCGLQLPADPLLSPAPACWISKCSQCTMNNPPLEISTQEGSSPFTVDALRNDPDGCVVRVLVCPKNITTSSSFIRFNEGAVNEREVGGGGSETRTLLRCNATGNGWNAVTASGKLNTTISKVTCFLDYKYW